MDSSSYLDVEDDDSSRQIKQALLRITSLSEESENEDAAIFYSNESAYTVFSSNQSY